MSTLAELQTPCPPNWCAGCGNMPIWLAFKKAAVEKGWDNSNTVMVAGIGCHGHIINFTKLSSFEGLHGRALPLASGIKMANKRLNVFVFTGDGDCLGEGGNHFMHSCRRNHNLTVILHDNGLYALTTGQTSPVTPHDFKTKSTPDGNPDYPLNPLTVAIASGATFVARAYASDMQHLQKLIIEANEHEGFALIDVLQPCVTFNKLFTHQFFQENTYYLSESYDSSNKIRALEKSQEFGIKSIPLGVLYKESKLSYESEIKYLENKPLIEIPNEGRDVQRIFRKYT